MASAEKKQQLKSVIVEIAAEQFRIHGIKAVKMDDIAALMKISKRTLYEIYDNKKDLIRDVLIINSQNLQQHMRKYAQLHDNVMDMLVEFFRLQADIYSQTNPVFFSDIKKYPDVMDQIDEFNRESHRNSLKFLQRGVEEGYFLASVKYPILSRLCRECLQMTRCNPDYNDFTPKDMFQSFVCVVIRGFCTTKGIGRLDEFLVSLNSQNNNINNE